MNFAHLSGINAILRVSNTHHSHYSLWIHFNGIHLKVQAATSECIQSILSTTHFLPLNFALNVK